LLKFVIPAKAGIQQRRVCGAKVFINQDWLPAFAGMMQKKNPATEPGFLFKPSGDEACKLRAELVAYCHTGFGPFHASGGLLRRFRRCLLGWSVCVNAITTADAGRC
jgi:hypothetical protein